MNKHANMNCIGNKILFKIYNIISLFSYLFVRFFQKNILNLSINIMSKSM